MDKRGKLCLIASPDGAEGSVRIHADAKIFAGLVDAAERVEQTIAKDRFIYFYVARGSVSLNDTPLHAGDAAKLTGESRFVLDRADNAEMLVFELK